MSALVTVAVLLSGCSTISAISDKQVAVASPLAPSKRSDGTACVDRSYTSNPQSSVNSFTPFTSVDNYEANLPYGNGPARTTFTECRPADYITFNSITDSNIGDERNFVRVRDEADKDSTYGKTATLVAGGTYLVFVYYQNDISRSVPNGTSDDARILVNLPKYVHGSGVAYSWISASNSRPAEEWDGFAVKTADPNDTLGLSIVPGSASLLTLGSANGDLIDTSDLQSGDGALIGCDALDGHVDGEDRCQGYLDFAFTAQAPAIAAGSYAYETGNGGSSDVRPGDVIQLISSVQNTSTNPISNVSAKISLAPGSSIIPGSVQYERVTSGKFGDWTVLGNQQVDPEGTYSNTFATVNPIPPGDEDRILYSVRVASDGTWACGDKWLPVTSTFAVAGIPMSSIFVLNVDGVC